MTSHTRGNVLSCALLFVIATQANAQIVHRRGGNAPIDAQSIELLPEGVQLKRKSGATINVPWDMVRSVEGFASPSDKRLWLERYQPLAADLWRARSRLQRGDARMAESLFARHFDDVVEAHADSELKLIVAEGLLRARLASGVIEGALPAALETIRLRRAGITTSRYELLPPVIDMAWWIIPRLAPVATDRAQVMVLDEKLARWTSSEDAYVAALAQGYARLGSGTKPETGAAGLGLELLGAALEAESDDAETRFQARATLTALAEDEAAPAWVGAWRRWFLARSILLEEDGELDLALVELLHIPAIHSQSNAGLAARAVALAAEHLNAANRQRESARLRRELELSCADVAPAIAAQQDAPETP